MTRPRISMQDRLAPKVEALLDDLSGCLAGEVRVDRLALAMYATDASIYQIIPDAVVKPRTVEDVAAVVRACAKRGLPVTPRGAGTGLTGGCVNRGVQVDCSRHLNRILEINPLRRVARVQSGFVLDELNAVLKPHGLHFAPDVATSNRATIGGMIGNDSCGAHSVIYGRTVDHVLGVELVLSDGSLCTWGAGSPTNGNDLARRCEETLAAVAREYADEIGAKYPKILRRNGGYGLDLLRPEHGPINAEAVISGSEGTLGIVTAAVLKLTPLPKCCGLLVAHFDDLLASLAAAPIALQHGPAAVELVDKLIFDAAEANLSLARRRSFLQGDPQAVLAVEMFDDRPDRLRERLEAVAAEFRSRGLGYAWPILTDPAGQADVWAVRKSGLGLLMSKPGDWQPYAFVEDTAVDPSRLRDYVEQFQRVLAEEGIDEANYYAHASVGCLHVRPVLNLKHRDDVQRMYRIADRVSSLALEFGGTMTGEHGDGIVRSCWLEKMYGPRLVEAFAKIKRAFDPQGILNPGKIVDPLPMTENLRYEPEGIASHSSATGLTQPGSHATTMLDFSLYGGMTGLAGMCSGVGECRKRLVGTMCPSYMATGEEKDSTRGRANAMRLALSDAGLLEGLADSALEEVMDLCLGCKACKAECPTGVDMAKLKAEWLHQRNLGQGAPRRSRLVAATPELAAWGSRLAPVSNWLLRLPSVQAVVERLYGLDRRVPPPPFARRTFRQWFSRHAASGSALRGETRAKPSVVYFVDTWTNHYTPEVGVAAVKVLEALGFNVIVPPTRCCGRPAISMGLLDKAGRLAEFNVARLRGYAERSIPIICTEPSCFSALVDEYPQLVRTKAARQVAVASKTIESFLADVLREGTPLVRRRGDFGDMLYHGHCHQKALVGTADALHLLKTIAGEQAREIDSGCCGMAGSFGHEVEHYEVAQAVGEQRLFPTIRAQPNASVAVSGFSCRQQIEQHTGASVRHVVEYLAEAWCEATTQ